MASYDSIRGTLKTGDIVIFSGKSAVSNFIKLFSGGKSQTLRSGRDGAPQGRL
jgi:hypothetical protein